MNLDGAFTRSDWQTNLHQKLISFSEQSEVETAMFKVGQLRVGRIAMTKMGMVVRLCATALLFATTASAQEAPESLNVYFDTGSAKLAADQREILDQAARLFRDGNPIVMIVSGGTDTVGSPDLNLALSVNRAEAVAKGLADRGIPAGRLQVVGRGTSELEVATPEGVAELKNRVVEITWR